MQWWIVVMVAVGTDMDSRLASQHLRNAAVATCCGLLVVGYPILIWSGSGLLICRRLLL